MFALLGALKAGHTACAHNLKNWGETEDTVVRPAVLYTYTHILRVPSGNAICLFKYLPGHCPPDKTGGKRGGLLAGERRKFSRPRLSPFCAAVSHTLISRTWCGHIIPFDNWTSVIVFYISFCSLQVVEDGYEFFAKRQLVTLFSAPNYCGEFDNAGAMMSVDETLMCSFQILKVRTNISRKKIFVLGEPIVGKLLLLLLLDKGSEVS